MADLNPTDERLLRHVIGLSSRARDNGDQPYGALLADGNGVVLLEAVNAQVTERDCTAHAELRLMRAASARFGHAALAACTVVASGEPCPMCAGAIYWGGVGRVVFGMSIATMTRLAGPAADELGLGCREVFNSGRRAVEVVGPALEHEASRILTGQVAPGTA